MNGLALDLWLEGMEPNDQIIALLQARGEGLVTRADVWSRLPFDLRETGGES